MAYATLEPFGPIREDQRAGVIAAMIANVNRDTSEHPEPFTVEEFLPRLHGDLSLATLAELRRVQTAVTAIVECLRVEMESTVLATHAADEAAVSAYFDFAHGLAVTGRLREMAAEMEDVIELVMGGAPSVEATRTFEFPD